MAKKWKQLCLSEHGDACNDPMRIASPRPAWVIDVQENCVVSGRDCASFVALSYVWGKHSWLRVDMDTLAVLQKPGALVDVAEIATNLAPIVRHAMHLTVVLEERYLWIDALCIVQGDGNVYDQLNSMGSFYASAVVTIVAADGESQSGLLGLEGVSKPRQVHQEIVPFGEEKLVFGGAFEDGGFASSSYSKRGWTYQEYLMSKRRLIIHNKRLHWECMCHRKHEDTLREDDASETLHDIKRGFPDLEYLNWTVSHYNEREFSYEEDALPGISGLLSNMSRTFTGGFLCGLPEIFFDRALGWVPNNGYTDLRRRTPSGEGQHKTTRAKDPSLTILPSWSWLGWHGEVRLSEHRNPEAVTVDDFWPISEETIPTTEWYTSNDAHGVNLRRIRSSWYENRDTLYKDFLRPLPQGWSRVEVETNKSDSDSDSDVSKNGIPHELMFPSGCGRYIFKHEKLPHVKWHYPFPVVNFASAAQVMPEQTRYLFCKTQGARLFASRRAA
ncbi:hypothetical protein Daus18300_009881 [Diaporthe australafricana]|uniref:Heterokaryon incompatibility domain-containing protein n=1 Tax=Diaporthe australafricana TaxID=127596 RepID=A0ABR3WCA6_9PEZI